MKQRLLFNAGKLGRSRAARSALAMVAALALGSGCRHPDNKAGMESKATMPLNLAHAGVTPFTILVPADAKPYEMTAAEELRAYLGKITGAQFPICREGNPPPAGAVLSVGRTQCLAETFPRGTRASFATLAMAYAKLSPRFKAYRNRAMAAIEAGNQPRKET